MRKFISGRRFIALASASALAICLSVVATGNANAACSPVKATGKSVGSISIGSLNMPIKSFNYPAG